VVVLFNALYFSLSLSLAINNNNNNNNKTQFSLSPRVEWRKNSLREISSTLKARALLAHKNPRAFFKKVTIKTTSKLKTRAYLFRCLSVPVVVVRARLLFLSRLTLVHVPIFSRFFFPFSNLLFDFSSFVCGEYCAFFKPLDQKTMRTPR
jgi:hypothetical protein